MKNVFMEHFWLVQLYMEFSLKVSLDGIYLDLLFSQTGIFVLFSLKQLCKSLKFSLKLEYLPLKLNFLFLERIKLPLGNAIFLLNELQIPLHLLLFNLILVHFFIKLQELLQLFFYSILLENKVHLGLSVKLVDLTSESFFWDYCVVQFMNCLLCLWEFGDELLQVEGGVTKEPLGVRAFMHYFIHLLLSLVLLALVNFYIQS